MRKLLYGNAHLGNYVDEVLEHTPTWKEPLSSMKDFLIRVRNVLYGLLSVLWDL